MPFLEACPILAESKWLWETGECHGDARMTKWETCADMVERRISSQSSSLLSVMGEEVVDLVGLGAMWVGPEGVLGAELRGLFF